MELEPLARTVPALKGVQIGAPCFDAQWTGWRGSLTIISTACISPNAAKRRVRVGEEEPWVLEGQTRVALSPIISPGRGHAPSNPWETCAPRGGPSTS